jgi:hypothetical protein
LAEIRRKSFSLTKTGCHFRSFIKMLITHTRTNISTYNPDRDWTRRHFLFFFVLLFPQMITVLKNSFDINKILFHTTFVRESRSTNSVCCTSCGLGRFSSVLLSFFFPLHIPVGYGSIVPHRLFYEKHVSFYFFGGRHNFPYIRYIPSTCLRYFSSSFRTLIRHFSPEKKSFSGKVFEL